MRQGFDGGGIDCPLCGAVVRGGDSFTFCHRVCGARGVEEEREWFGVTRDEELEEILLFGEKTAEKEERSIALLMWRRTEMD